MIAKTFAPFLLGGWGRLLFVSFSCALLLYLIQLLDWMAVGLAVGLATLWPRQRLEILGVALIWNVWHTGLKFRQDEWESASPAIRGLLLAVLAVAFTFTFLNSSKKLRGIGSLSIMACFSSAIICLKIFCKVPLAIYWTAVCIGRLLPPALIVTLVEKKLTGRKALANLIFLKPIWTMEFIAPIPSLPSILAETPKNNAELEAIQWRGLKLLAWALVFKMLFHGYDFVLFGGQLAQFYWPDSLFDPISSGPVMSVNMLLRAMARGYAPSVLESWASVIGDFIGWCLTVTVIGHVTVGTARLFGFSLKRNTYKPYLAKDFLDFFSRYNFYFKELLLNLFFYPVFIRLSGVSRDVRIFVAALAVGAGNFLIHFCYFDIGFLLRESTKLSLGYFLNYLTFCAILIAIVFLSMRAALSRTGPAFASPIWRVLNLLFIVVIFAIQKIFDCPFFDGRFNLSLKLVFALGGL